MIIDAATTAFEKTTTRSFLFPRDGITAYDLTGASGAATKLERIARACVYQSLGANNDSNTPNPPSASQCGCGCQTYVPLPISPVLADTTVQDSGWSNTGTPHGSPGETQDGGFLSSVRLSGGSKHPTLLHGPSGVGKAYVIRRIAASLGLHVTVVDCHTLTGA